MTDEIKELIEMLRNHDLGARISLPRHASYILESLHTENERLTAQHESDKTLVRITEDCARKHQERAREFAKRIKELEER